MDTIVEHFLSILRSEDIPALAALVLDELLRDDNTPTAANININYGGCLSVCIRILATTEKVPNSSPTVYP